MMRRALAVGVLALALAGCRADVTTQVVVTSESDARARVEVSFEGEAAKALSRDDNLSRLLETYEHLTGVQPEVSRGGGTLGVSAELDYETLKQVAGVTGVRSLRLEPETGGEVTVTAELVEPVALIEAIVATAHEQEDDPGPYLAAVAGSSWVTLRIELPGGVSSAQVPVEIGGETTRTALVVSQPLSEFVPGTVSVTGTPGRAWPRLPSRPLVLLAGTAVVLAGGFRYAARRAARP
jgi:hypothetical protein